MKLFRWFLTFIFTAIIFFSSYFITLSFAVRHTAAWVAISLGSVYLLFEAFRILRGKGIEEPSENVHVMEDKNIRCFHCGTEFEAAFIGPKIAMSVTCPNCGSEIDESNFILAK